MLLIQMKRYPGERALEYCKLLILQDVQENNSLNLPGAKKLIEKTKKECISIKIPNLYGCNLNMKENKKSLEEALDDGEIFIYVCVRKALGLRFSQDYIKQYRDNKTLHNHALDIREYIEEYLAWYFIA